MGNYSIVLFKNKIAKKILKEFITFRKAKEFFDKEIKKSESILFETKFENGKPCTYEIALIENSNSHLIPVYLTDEFGRNVKVKLENSGKTISQISVYRKEEKLFDLQEKRKLTIENILKRYLKGDGLKMISSLNNKVVFQNDDKINLISLKNENEVSRLLDFLTFKFMIEKRKDCLIVKDNSSAQRKYLIGVLEKYGFDKKTLYRKSTTHPRK